MAISEAQKKAVAKYNAKAYDRLELKVAKGTKSIIQTIAEQQNKSVNGYIKEAVEEKIKADTGKDIEL
mgnify:CR=1 FL=1